MSLAEVMLRYAGVDMQPLRGSIFYLMRSGCIFHHIQKDKATGWWPYLGWMYLWIRVSYFTTLLALPPCTLM